MVTKQKYKVRNQFCLHLHGMIYPAGIIIELSEEEFFLCRHMVEIVLPSQKTAKKAEETGDISLGT